MPFHNLNFEDIARHQDAGIAACTGMDGTRASCSGWHLHRAPIPEEEPLEPLPGEEPAPDQEEPPPHPDPSLSAFYAAASSASRRYPVNSSNAGFCSEQEKWHDECAKFF